MQNKINLNNVARIYSDNLKMLLRIRGRINLLEIIMILDNSDAMHNCINF